MNQRRGGGVNTLSKLCNFKTQMTLRHLLQMPMNKNLSGTTTKYILKEIHLLINTFYIYSYMIKKFLKNLCCRFLVPRSEQHVLVSSATLSWLCLCILTLPMLLYYKGASAKNFCHACMCILAAKGVGCGFG